MATPYGLLVEGLSYAGLAEDEFNDWYDNEHIPGLLRIKGITNAQRWLNAEEVSLMPGLGGNVPNLSVAIYDLESLDVLQSPAYRAIADAGRAASPSRVSSKCRRICHFEAEQILPGRQAGPDRAGGLMMFGFNVPPEVEGEFNAWFNDEHIPRLSAVDGVLCARRFRMAGGTHRYLAVYHLAAPEVQSSQAWVKAGASPWTTRMQSYFLAPGRNPLRFALRRYGGKN